MAKLYIDEEKNYALYEQYGDNSMGSIGPLGLIPMVNSTEFSAEVNDRLYKRRMEYQSELIKGQGSGFLRKDYTISADYTRYSTGEGRVIILGSVRGHDVFILCDVLNHSCTYPLFGEDKFMSPDEHYQDLKRVILAISGKARRINVIMPFLYDSRQHKRNGRESLDCAFMLEELHNLGVNSIITFDAHDPRVANAIPVSGFENIPATYQIIKSLAAEIGSLSTKNPDLMIISPDEGALPRSMYYANVLGCPLGTFYKRRDYTKVVDGRNPILKHEFLGESAKGKDVLIVDDMIASGDSMLDICKEMRSLGARNIYCAATFGLFTSGTEIFDKAYEEGYVTRVFTTNLIYRLPELQTAPWYREVNMSKFVALLIDAINHDASLTKMVNQTERIQTFLGRKPKKNGKSKTNRSQS